MKNLITPYFNTELALTKNELTKINEIETSNQDISMNLSLDKKIRHQVLSRKKIQKKLPTFYNCEEIIYPVSLSLEQASSEITAKYKANIILGKTFIDLAAGMGIDSFFFAQQFEKGILIERNETLAKIDLHNYFLLNQTNVEIAVGIDSIEFINNFKEKIDLIYIDPARRDEQGNKVVSLTEYEPNVISILDKLFEISDSILIKTSPLLDLTIAISELKFVKEIHIISVENECKELVFHLEKNCVDEIKITTINFDKKQKQAFSFLWNEEKNVSVEYSLPQKYLYEPNASIMKAGAFKTIGIHLGLQKLHQHTHLYTSGKLIENFPGRVFKINHISKVDKKVIQQFIPSNKANISVRNFPLSVAELRKKTQRLGRKSCV